ncbi:hypothetical protein TIFTF001_023589 [Ficus carica]|uniref:Uncharacterized protein n=1 Tax=Ficus carica TaxID=3494 RepID=A0AA88AJV5_FICCA|nr:hypothetical protein TIFTF001_023589 [Ficus carica]
MTLARMPLTNTAVDHLISSPGSRVKVKRLARRVSAAISSCGIQCFAFHSSACACELQPLLARHVAPASALSQPLLATHLCMGP